MRRFLDNVTGFRVPSANNYLTLTIFLLYIKHISKSGSGFCKCLMLDSLNCKYFLIIMFNFIDKYKPIRSTNLDLQVVNSKIPCYMYTKYYNSSLNYNTKKFVYIIEIVII